MNPEKRVSKTVFLALIGSTDQEPDLTPFQKPEIYGKWILYTLEDAAPPRRLPNTKRYHLPLHVTLAPKPNRLTATEKKKQTVVSFTLRNNRVKTIHFFTGEILTGHVEVTKTEMVWRLHTTEPAYSRRTIVYHFLRCENAE